MTMTTSGSDVLLDSDPVVLEQLDFEESCSWYEEPCGTPASWSLTTTCGCVRVLCDHHLHVALHRFRDPTWHHICVWCTVGCTGYLSHAPLNRGSV